MRPSTSLHAHRARAAAWPRRVAVHCTCTNRSNARSGVAEAWNRPQASDSADASVVAPAYAGVADVLLLENFLHADDFQGILEECTALR